MAKPFPKFGPYNIIADTNALRSRDSRKLVSGGFEAALTELRKIATVQLYIPAVVVGELAYQKFESAVGAIAALEKNFNILAELLGGRRPTTYSSKNAKEKILKRYNAWCRTLNARRFVPKIEQTSWNKIVEDAVWRVSPFERSEDGKNEKGFRDRVVLESVIQLCSGTTVQTVLLSEDGLLSKAAGACGAKNLTIVPRLEDFTSRIRLLKEEETKEWVDSLFSEAARAFYAEDKPNCIYWANKIPDQITARVADLLPPPSDAGVLALLEPKTWERQSEERITLGTTQYEKVAAHRYYWKTEVKSAAAFSGKGLADLLHENIRVSTFAVRWSSQVNDVAEVSDVKFESIELAGKQMIPDTAEARTDWSLPAKPVSPLLGLGSMLNLNMLQPPK